VLTTRFYGAEPSAASMRSCSSNTYEAKLKFGATVHVPHWQWTWMLVWGEKFISAMVR